MWRLRRVSQNSSAWKHNFNWCLRWIHAKCEGLDGEGAGPHDHALYPDPDEGQQRAEGDHDVSVVRPRLGDHAAQLRVAVGPWNTTLVSCQCGVTSPLQIVKKISSKHH